MSKIMKKFNLKNLIPHEAILSSFFFENTFLNIPKTLFYKIEISLKPFIIGEETVETSIDLGFIDLKISELKEIENRTFHFPINPEKGYIDGSVYLFDVHNPFDVKQITFGKFKDNMIEATFLFNIDFEFEGNDYQNINDAEMTISLQIGELNKNFDTENE